MRLTTHDGAGRWVPYRVRQFVLAIFAPVPAAELKAAVHAAALPADAARLVRAMPRAYQRHALNVLRRLHAQGHADPRLLQAALLHDIGKWDPESGARVGLAPRIATTLIGHVRPGRAVLRLLAAGPPDSDSWRYPWYLQAAHPTLGAQMALRAGVHPDVVSLVHWHQDAVGIPDHLRDALGLLQQADARE